MPYDPSRHHRRSIRLKGHDYTTGSYFVTICAQGRLRLFGDISSGVMRLGDAGRMIEAVWLAMPERFAAARLDAYAVMPDHFHAIVSLRGGEARLGDVVGAFKSLATHAYIRGVRDAGWRQFAGRLWQRNYYEHVIRDEADLARIRAYIARNPARWEADRKRAAVVPLAHRNIPPSEAYHATEGTADPEAFD